MNARRRMVLPVSWKLAGSVLLVKFPKWLSASAALVLLRLPVPPAKYYP